MCDVLAGLAIIGAALANRGTFHACQVLSEEGWAALHSHATQRSMSG